MLVKTIAPDEAEGRIAESYAGPEQHFLDPDDAFRTALTVGKAL